jgi:alpha-glucosidase (family GH31 glycosyl hydrolase)
LLDTYLGKLDSVSRRWFADGSPSDMRADQWNAVGEVKTVEARDNVAILHCVAGSNPVDLHLSFPTTGGIRLWANEEGFFKPVALLPLTVRNSGDSTAIISSNEQAVVTKKGFGIILRGPDGKEVRLRPGSIAFRFDSRGNVLAADFRNHLDRDEVIYGFGEKYDRFNENGNVLTLWGVDDWVGNTEGLRNQSYKPVPVFHSSKGYTVFVNSTYRLRADIGKTRAGEYRLTQAGPVFDYYLWIEPPEPAIESYTALTGKPLLPPKWAFEPWIGRTGRGWGDGPLHNPVAEEEQVVKRFSELDIPHSAIYAEGSSADSPELNAFMSARGLHVLSWFYSSIGRDTQARLMPELPTSDLPLLDTGDDSSDEPINYVDFTNPHALELCRRWWKGRLDLGVAGSMVDFGDRTPERAVFYDGRKGDEMHNFYSYDYQRTYHQVFAERRGDDFILFGRAAAPGTQRWAAQFAGDHRANFVGLRAVLTGALNLCACGFSTWGSDLGGFLGWPDPAVYMRWTQFACFSPLMRSHGRPPREPWEFGAAAIANYKYFAWVRENLLDYIYGAAKFAHQASVPIMRSMAVAYPNIPSLAGVDDQYLFGPDLLVAPITSDNNSRLLSLPPGKWISLWDGTVASAKTRVAAPLDKIPVYLREGAIIPVDLSTNLRLGESMTPGRVHALVISPSAKSFHIENGDASYLLIYGASMATVKVDGSVLPRGETFVREGRVIVQLPPVATGRNTREIEIELGTPHTRG